MSVFSEFRACAGILQKGSVIWIPEAKHTDFCGNSIISWVQFCTVIKQSICTIRRI